MNWYECIVRVGHQGVKKEYFSTVYVKATSISEVEDKLEQVPAVGNYHGKKQAKSIVMSDREFKTNKWYIYSKEFKDILDSEPIQRTDH